MGQHKHNLQAQMAARGELKPRIRDKSDKPTILGTLRSVLASVGIGGYRPYHADGRGCIRRTTPKVKGKANVKRAKKARRLARESAHRIATAA